VSRKNTDTYKQVAEQIDAHGIEFGKRYCDPASEFEGEVTALYFFKHGCMRVSLATERSGHDLRA